MKDHINNTTSPAIVFLSNLVSVTISFVFFLVMTNALRVEFYSKKIGDAEFISSKIVIGNNVWVGANVTILRGTTIGDDCVIGAGCVIKGNIEPKSKIVQKR